MIQTVKYTYRFSKDSLRFNFKLNVATGDSSFSWHIVVVSKLESLFGKQVFDSPFSKRVHEGALGCADPLKNSKSGYTPLKDLLTHHGCKGGILTHFLQKSMP